MSPTPLTLFNLLLMVVVCSAGVARGRPSLQLASAVLALDGFASEVLQDHGGHKAQPYILIIDVLYTTLLLLILVRSDSRWPKYAFVSNVLIVLTHLMANLDRGLTRWAFFSAYYVFSYALLASLAAAAVFEPGRASKKYNV